MHDPIRLELLTLGDELLIGIRDNGHLTWLGKELTSHGLQIQRNVVMRDDPENIRRFFANSWEQSDIVITTGGLGPTQDDLTRETVADILGLKLIHHPPTEKAIRARFRRMKRQVTDNNLRQTYLLEGAEALPNHYGTAPGQWLERDGKVLIMLPGPGSEMKPMFEEQVLPRLQAMGLATKQDAYIQLRTMGVGESALETMLQPLFDKYPGRLGVAFCAHEGMVDLRLSPVGHSLDWQVVEKVAAEARAMLGDDCLCEGNDCLGCIVVKKLRAMGKTLSVAESCTGGLLSSAFTDVAGASKVFTGGLVCYQNDVKIQNLGVPESIIQQHGPVSAECAVAMATGAAEMFGSDYALSVTGFAGPGGGTEEHPVGTIFLGYCSPLGVWSRKVVLPGNRLAVKARAVNMSLDWMRRKLREHEVEEMLASVKTN